MGIVFAVLFLLQGCSMPQKPFEMAPNPDGLTLTTNKLVYAPGDTIELEIKNTGTKSVYFQESRFNELGLSGEVIGIAGRGEALEPTNTFDSADAAAPHDREPAKIFSTYPGISLEAMKAGYSYPYNWEKTLPNTLKTKWTGFAFRKTGPQVYELEKYQSMGKFKVRIYYAFEESDFSRDDYLGSYVESNEFEIAGNSTVTPTGYKTTELVRQELELTGELFQQLTVGYRSQYNLRVTDPQEIEKIAEAGLAAGQNLYRRTEKEIILNTFLPSKQEQELVGKKVKVTGTFRATLYEDAGSGKTLQLETPQVIQRFDADAVTISTFNSDNGQTIPLRSATIVPLDKVIRKSPQEVMFSSQELETRGVALNPDLLGAKWKITLIPEPATVTPEVGGSVTYSVKKINSKQETVIVITQFKGNRADSSDAIDFAKADYKNSAEKDIDLWNSLPEPIVGNERIAGQFDNLKIKNIESDGLSRFILFRRNNFNVYLQLSDYGIAQATNLSSVKALRELQTYAVLIDDKIQGTPPVEIVPFNEGSVSILTSKAVYQKNEPIEFEIRNNGDKQVYLMNSTDFDALSVSGNVLSLVGPNAFAPLNTFDTRASVLDTAGRIPPSPMALLPFKGFVTGTWNGFAFRANGPDPLNDWETFQPTGKFKISVVYAFESRDLTGPQDRELPYAESNEFEIR